MVEVEIKCIYCKGEEVVKMGYRITASLDVIAKIVGIFVKYIT